MEVKNGLINILTQYEGIIAALLGAVVGFSINEISKRIGKLRVYTKKYELQNLKSDMFKEYTFVETIEKSDTFGSNMNLQIYNSCNVQKVIRDIYITIECKDKTKFKFIPWIQGEKTRQLDYMVVNPKEFKEIQIYGYIDKKDEAYFNSLDKINSIHIIAKYPNGKQFKRKLI